jgi:hypothetical protein
MSGLTARSAMTARASHALGLATLTEDRLDEAFDWLSRLVAHDGQAAHYREALFGLIDLAEAGRRNGQRSETSQLVGGAQASIQGELSPGYCR